MSKKIQDLSRDQIAEFLPDAIRAAMNSYQTYSQSNNDDFKNHHTACKVAISHIDLLLKLARWADLPDDDLADKNSQKILIAAIAEAETELKGYEEHEE